MRRIVLILVCGLALLGVVGLTMGTAGAATTTYTYTNYHYKTSLVCNDCHTMHGTLQHDSSGGGTPATYAGNTTKLLKNTTGTTVTDLCLTCHDGAGGTAPDVKGLISGSQATPRSAGSIPTGIAPYENWKGHNVEVASATPPGSATAIAPFKCTSCHATHGSANYRNVRTDPGTGAGLTITPAIVNGIVSADFTGVAVDVVINAGQTTRPAYGTGTFYSGSNVFYLANGGAANNYSKWCAGCHTNFANSALSGTGKHPTGANIGAGISTTVAQFNNAGTKVPVLATTFTATAGVPSGTNAQAFCQSCHQAHGNQNPFMLLYVVSGTAIDENGGSTTAGTAGMCQVCHTSAYGG